MRSDANPCSRGARLPHVCLVALLIFLLGAPVAANAGEKKPPPPYALIFGTVWTPDARPAGGVRVKIRRAEEKKARWELVSDRRGEFAQRVPAGTADYVVWAEVKGHKGPAAETKVHIENDERQDIGLHLTK
ncbi:MAG: hypothetical protein ACE14L_12030 [Terriglobales bacterium]